MSNLQSDRILQSNLVQDLYDSLVNSQRMRPILLGNIQHLRDFETSHLFPIFMNHLARKCSKVKGTASSGLKAIALLILCCLRYDFNGSTVQQYTNPSINGIWRAIHTAKTHFEFVSSTSSSSLDRLFNGRTQLGFKKISCSFFQRWQTYWYYDY